MGIYLLQQEAGNNQIRQQRVFLICKVESAITLLSHNLQVHAEHKNNQPQRIRHRNQGIL